ncbi:MAG: NACHT domain-containing protein [Moorea sp. SIO3I7]|nr:NACHT domain-containing protein [Moorena sp. SIO3I7]
MSEDPKKVSNNDLPNSQFGGGFVDADTVNVGQLGGDINNYNVVVNPPPTLTRQEYRNRQALLTKVKNFWVKGVLEKSLYHQVLIELGLEERPDAITNPLSEIIEIGDDSSQPLPEGTKVIDVFDEIGTGATLLILGEPGSGKTTTLLELARDLIARAEQDTNQLIPVVFNLSSWAKKRQTIADWLVEELNTVYQVPNKIGQALVTQQQLLPLLDGLDEVKAEYRNDCIVALNKFHQKYGAELVVCSRIKDYQALSNRLNFQKAVCIRLLTLEEVCHYLDSVGADLTGLRTLIAQYQEWQELAQSPLMLNIMTLAYQGVVVEYLPKNDVVEKLRLQIFNDYIERMFKHRKTNRQYKNAQVKHWLIWLAQRVAKESQTVFFLEKMQPYWLINRKQKRTYRLMVGLMIVLMFGLMFGLMAGLMSGLMVGLMVGLVVGLMVGLVVGLDTGLIVVRDKEVTEEIKTVKILQVNWKKILIYLLTEGLIIGLMAGLIIGLMFGQMFGLMIGLMAGLMIGLEAGLIKGLMTGLIKGLEAGLESSEIETKTSPNQGIWKSARNAITVCLMGGLTFGLMVGLMVGLMEGLMVGLMEGMVGLIGGLMVGLMIGLMVGLIGGLKNGGKACIQHFILRLVLYFNNYIPWNYARFLDYAADRIFLQKVGGGYIFIHRMLMEHFAEMELEN